MLEAYLRAKLNREDKVYSAGWEPSGVDPQAIRVMAEDRVVIAGQTSDSIEQFQRNSFDFIVLLDPGGKSYCEAFEPKAKILSFEIEEIDGFGGAERMDAVRKLRDQLKELALQLSQEISS